MNFNVRRTIVVYEDNYNYTISVVYNIIFLVLEGKNTLAISELYVRFVTWL